MFVYKDGKLYIQQKDSFIGVDVYSDKVVEVEGTEVKLRKPYKQYALSVIRTKFNVAEKPYTFPRPKKVVVEEEVKTEPKKRGTKKVEEE